MHGMRRLLSLVVRRVRISGDSMVPTFRDGDETLAVRRWRPVRVGDLVIAPDPRDPRRQLVKRCVGRTGRLASLAGDNPSASTDSRSFGPVPVRSIRYLVLRTEGSTQKPS
jgi:phage repressor protein C with HTH and peptisase S24 domain